MDVNILTIANMLGQPAGPVQVGARPDAPTRDARFSPTREHPQPRIDTTRPTTPPPARGETPDEPAREERRHFKEVIDKQTKPRDPEKTPNHGKPTQQNAESGAADQSDAAQPAPVQNPAAAENNKAGTTPTSEPKPSQQLAQLIEGARTQKNQPAVVEISKSPEIKLTSTAQKKQPGAEAVSAKALKNIGADTASAKNAGKLPISNGAAAGTQAVPKGNDAKQLAPDASTAGDVKPANTGKEQTVAADSPVAAPAKTPVASISTSMDEVPVDSDLKKNGTGQNTAAADASKVQSLKTDKETAVQPAQGQPSASKSDKVTSSSNNQPGNTQEPLPTTKTEPDDAVAQTPTRSANANGRNSGHLGKNTGNEASDPGQVQTTANQTETGDGSHSGGKPLPDSAQILSQTPAQTAATGQAPIFAVGTEQTATAEQPPTAPGNPLGDVSNQILESVRSSLSQQTGNKEITIQLNPPELGKVSVKFQEQGSEITGTLEVSKAQTRTEIEQALPEIIRSLADSGVAIKRLEVVLTQDEQSQQHGSRDPLFQDGQFQQRDSANPGQSDRGQQATQTYYGPTGRSAYQYQTAANPYEMMVTNTSINMLV